MSIFKLSGVTNFTNMGAPMHPGVGTGAAAAGSGHCTAVGAAAAGRSGRSAAGCPCYVGAVAAC